VPGHRVPWLVGRQPSERTKLRSDLTPLFTETKEADMATPLGAIASIGFLTLIALGLAAPCAPSRLKPVVGDLGKLNLAAILLAALGGFSELIAMYVTLKIRCYNRISIFIGFFALAALAVLVSREARGHGAARANGPVRGRSGYLIALWVVTALGLFDQIPLAWTPDHARDAIAFRSDQEFVAAVEKALPPRSMIFQLPPNSFPEFGRHFAMYDYSHFRGYLHSRELRWSYGALRGRAAEKLHSRLAPLSPAALVDELVAAGFSGVYVNRNGHKAGGQELVQALRQKLGQEPITNRDGSLLFFRLPVVPAAR
jgi:phosphoglycerol transferase